MKKITALILAFSLLLAGCGSIEDEARQTNAPAASITEQTSQGGERQPEETTVMTTVFGTTAGKIKPAEKGAETTATHKNLKNLEEDTVMYTTSQQQENLADERTDPVRDHDSGDMIPRGFFDSITYAEYRDFDETRYVVEGEGLETLKNGLSAFAGKKCEDPVMDGWYTFVLKDNAGNEHHLELAGNYVILNGEFYHDPGYDPDGSRSAALAEYFRANGRRADKDEMTAEFELVQLRPGGKSGYVIHDNFGLTSFFLKDGSLEEMPAGTMLRISWSGRIAEIYPSVLEGVTSVTLANNLANPSRPDFVTDNLPALIEACRGKDDYSAEIDKLTGLTSREKEALGWLVGNALYE